MFETLQEGLTSALRTLRGRGKLTEANMRDGLRLVQQALLEADVSIPVVKEFMARVTRTGGGRGGAQAAGPHPAVGEDRPRRAGRADGAGRSLAAPAVAGAGADALRPARVGQDDHLRQAGPDGQAAGPQPDAGRRRLAASGGHRPVAGARREAGDAGLRGACGHGSRGGLPGGDPAGAVDRARTW